MLDGPPLKDPEIKAKLSDATISKELGLLPSIETLFHAFLLSLPGVNFIGHTHPVAVNSVLCSKVWREATKGRIFPDEIVCCGIAPAYVEYTDPGVELGRLVRTSVEDYIKENGVRPKAVLMQNHGLIAIGGTMNEVKSVTAMWNKTAKVLAGTYQFGGPNYLTEAHVDRIYTRPDEEQRLKLIEGR
jgi:rhamnose utilization protein RhaD (predicted bifunctional aldolase and dehydrogenase)